MLATIRRVHDKTIDRYTRLGLNNSTTAWLFFAVGIFALLHWRQENEVISGQVESDIKLSYRFPTVLDGEKNKKARPDN